MAGQTETPSWTREREIEKERGREGGGGGGERGGGSFPNQQLSLWSYRSAFRKRVVESNIIGKQCEFTKFYFFQL